MQKSDGKRKEVEALCSLPRYHSENEPVSGNGGGFNGSLTAICTVTMTVDDWKQWLKNAKKRTKKDSEIWTIYNYYNPNILRKLKTIMGLTSVYLLPDDKLAYIFYNPYCDMRDVEAMLDIEENFGISLLPFIENKNYLNMSLNDLMKLAAGGAGSDQASK